MGAMDRIYLDWNSTAPLLDGVREAMVDALDAIPGNASSVHREGQMARSIVERCRRAIGRAIGAPAQAVILCGGATEGNNQILRTHAKYTQDAMIVCSAIEHPSVIEVVEHLDAEGICATRVIGVDAMGRLDLDQLRAHLEEGATLVSVMWANNENGNIAPIEQIAHMCHEYGALLHTDATQALGRIPLDFASSGADMMTLSLHKMGGPKGIGAVVVREGLTLESMLAGGHQERGRRPGTENVPAAAAARAAAELVVAHRAEWTEELGRKRALFLDTLRQHSPSFVLRQDPEACLPNTVNVAFDGIGGEDLLLALDLAGVAASAGSACTAGSLEPSHVILAMGYEGHDAKRSVRLSFGPTTTDDQLREAARRIGDAAGRLARLKETSTVE